jgi:hypothetical protein
MAWQGITYPGILCHPPVLWLWRRLACPHGWHLWDEVIGVLHQHSLSCDACDLALDIAPRREGGPDG